MSYLERGQLMGIWYQLSDQARVDLVTNLSSMLGVSPAPEPPPVGALGRPATAGPKVKAWDRPILRDVPLFQQFGQMTKKERADDDKGISQLLSISMGVIKRGRDSGVADQDILAALLDALRDPERLKLLFQPPASSDDDMHDPPDGDGRGGSPPPPDAGGNDTTVMAM
jgi:hypothetical protein